MCVCACVCVCCVRVGAEIAHGSSIFSTARYGACPPGLCQCQSACVYRERKQPQDAWT